MITLLRFGLAATLLLFFSNLHAQPWVEQAPMKLKRSEATAVDYDGKLYVFNGFSRGLLIGNSIERYDPQSKQWTLIGTTQTANGTATTHTGAVVVGNFS